MSRAARATSAPSASTAATSTDQSTIRRIGRAVGERSGAGEVSDLCERRRLGPGQRLRRPEPGEQRLDGRGGVFGPHAAEGQRERRVALGHEQKFVRVPAEAQPAVRVRAANLPGASLSTCQNRSVFRPHVRRRVVDARAFAHGGEERAVVDVPPPGVRAGPRADDHRSHVGVVGELDVHVLDRQAAAGVVLRQPAVPPAPAGARRPRDLGRRRRCSAAAGARRSGEWRPAPSAMRVRR